uniref:Ameloblastin n=1 Tax=Dicentrarchus labrax TaxID=13489 RepID=A0A8P4GMQ7_DICLA
MIIVILLSSCFTIMVSAGPVLPPLLSQGGVTQGTNQEPDAQTPAPLSPRAEQPQSGVPQQPGPQGGPQVLPPTQHYTWSPLGGDPMIMPLQPSIHGSQPNQPTLPQQPWIFPPYTYFPLLSSPYSNQLFSPYGFPIFLASPLPQTPANQPPNRLVLPAETPSGAVPSGNTPQPIQPIQQQQNPQIVYMLQQRMMAAKMAQLGVYLPNVLTNPSAGAVQPVNQAAGLKNPEQQGIVPTVGTSSIGVPQTQSPASSGPQPNTNRVPLGLERPTQEAATVQTPAEPKLQSTQGNLV